MPASQPRPPDVLGRSPMGVPGSRTPGPQQGGGREGLVPGCLRHQRCLGGPGALHAAPPGPWALARAQEFRIISALPASSAGALLLSSPGHIWNQLPRVSAAGAGGSRRSGEWKTRPPSWHRPQLPLSLSLPSSSLSSPVSEPHPRAPWAGRGRRGLCAEPGRGSPGRSSPHALGPPPELGGLPASRSCTWKEGSGCEGLRDKDCPPDPGGGSLARGRAVPRTRTDLSLLRASSCPGGGQPGGGRWHRPGTRVQLALSLLGALQGGSGRFSRLRLRRLP